MAQLPLIRQNQAANALDVEKKIGGNQLSVEDCKKYVIFRDIRQNQAANAHIDGATPSYLPTSINQPNRSELSQDRRQNHQERHQSCPFWDIDGATASYLGITLIDVAYVVFLLGWLMDVGKYEGVAPSMRPFAA